LSALTKVAIILLVIASLLLSAGVVVFVNKVEDYAAAARTSDDQLKKERLARTDAQNQLTLMTQQNLELAKDANTRTEALKKESSDKDVQIGDLKGQLAKLDQDKKGVEVALANMTAVQKGQQEQLAAAQQQITDLRKIRDDLVTERQGINVQLTDANAKVEALERARRTAEERAAGLRAQVDEQEQKLKGTGLTWSTLPNRTNAAPHLEGVVREVFVAGGKPWASVTIGSKDNVEKGMKFNVVNNSEFLGYLTIQTTEPNEAAGVLEGPKVEKVRQGDQIKTQLQ
jgi:hypothetical protein